MFQKYTNVNKKKLVTKIVVYFTPASIFSVQAELKANILSTDFQEAETPPLHLEE